MVQHAIRQLKLLHLTLWIPDINIGIGLSLHQRAFLRIQAVQLGRIGRSDLDELGKFEAVRAEGKGESCFNAWTAVGYVLEVAERVFSADAGFLARLSIIVAEGTVVRGKDRKGAVCKSFPDYVAVCLALPWWGRADALCAFETGLV